MLNNCSILTRLAHICGKLFHIKINFGEKMRSNISLLIFFSLLSNTFSQSVNDSLSSEIKLRTYIEDENVPLNREVIYHIELRWEGDLSRYKISEVLEPTITNLATRGGGSSNKVLTDPDGSMISVKEITFQFKPLEIGMAYIDGVTIRYTDQVKEREESLISSRLGIKIIEPLPEPSDNNVMSGILYGLLVFVAIVTAIYLYLNYRKKKQEAERLALTDPQETLEEKYLRLLKETIHLNTDNVKDSLNDLTHLLNGYLSEKYNFPVSNLSVENLVGALKDKDLSDESLTRISDYFSKANLVKFAGESVEDSEFHRLYDAVELVLDHQKNITTEDTEEDK